VALVLVSSPESLLLIRRADRAGDPWSGHMALPGGRRAATDADLVDTAIREALEEVGMRLGREQLAGRLADVIPRTPTLPPIAVRPFVFLLSTRPQLALNAEVSAAAWIPVDHLLQRATYRPVQLELRGETREFPAYHLEDAFVWGMTERILTDLLEEFRRAES
jgi:8-oxo-dGTP pyrophosphatase MutT (NUDIX family)